MHPTLATNDKADLLTRYIVASRDRNARLTLTARISYVKNVLLIKFSHVVMRSLARWGYPAALLIRHVLKIVSLCSEKQMIRTHADRIVAVMTDAHSFWNRSVGKFPRQPMGEHLTAASVRCEPSTVWAHAAVTFPAVRSKRDRLPELNAFTFWCRFRHWHSANVITFSLT